MRFRAVFMACGSLAAAAVLTAARQPSPKLAIVAPTASDSAVGRVSIAVAIDPPATPVAEIRVFADGIPVCRIVRQPYRCDWDAGSVLTPHDIRAVAALQDGTRVTQTVRTRGSAATFRSTTNAVFVPVRVKDGDGHFIQGLTQNDFAVFEDGQPQTISSFSSEDAAFDIVLALDISASMTPRIGQLKDAARHFLSSVRPQDSVTLAAFNTNLFVLAPRAAPGPQRLAAVDRLRAGGSTALYDVMASATALFRERQERRALVVFSDGDDVSSKTTPEGARTALQAGDAVLFLVAQGRGASEDALRKRLTALAAETGGEAFFPSSMSAVADHFSTILQNLSRIYLLAYTPARPLGDAGWRRIEVKLTNKTHARRYTVNARGGYFATTRGAR
jgi:Ca-activated chloride channel homolog